MIEQSWCKNELCGRKYAGIGGLPLLAPTQSVSTGDAKWLQAVPRERWIKATGRGIPMSLITEGRLWRGTWENPEVGTVSDLLSERSFDSPVLQTSAVRFHLDQRAQPQFQACKHSETSAAQSVIFPLRIFQLDILKQTPSCCQPHPWPLELWPLCVHICAGFRGKYPRMVFLIVRKWAQIVRSSSLHLNCSR